MELLDFPLRNPFEMVNDDPYKYVLAKDICAHLGKTITMLAYFITDKITGTSTNHTMCFGTFMDVNLDWVDTVHFPDSASKYPLHNNGFYSITGKVVEEFGAYSLEVHKMIKVGYKNRSYANLG